MALFLLLVLSLALTLVAGGSPCPEREMIHPCYCVSIQQSKRITYTIITCGHVHQTSSLNRIFSTLRSMNIDRFILYDSFWEMDKLDENRRLPRNWMSLLKIKEFDIVDSRLSHDFACDLTAACPNTVMTHLTIRNSSSSDSITTLCKQDGKMIYWTSCLSKLRYAHFDKNNLVTFDKSVFPSMMRELLTLNLSRNSIKQIGPDAFAQLPKLTTLDLSYNTISTLPEGIFGKTATVISYLDLSENMIKQLPQDLFRLTPYLTSFLARNNQMQKLPYATWKPLSEKIKLIDLADNLLECDCHVIWLNCTLKVHTNVLGFCVNEGYENTPLRRVAKYMSERCDKDGNIHERANGTKGNACLGWWKVIQSGSLGLNPYSDENRIQVVSLPIDATSRSQTQRKRHSKPR